MQIICISRGCKGHGEEFALNLAKKLDYNCLSREDLLEEATKLRIPIGKLETAIIKPHLLNDKLAIELEHYKALATSILCKRALNGNVIYHGRTGHLLLHGISHILKLRVVMDMEFRINYIMEKLDLPREKAKKYIEQVDEDRRRWVRQFYNTEWHENNLYDLILNLSYMSINNAASAVCNIAQLPEFQATPSSINSLKDLYLASKAKLLVFGDKSTKNFNLRMKAHDGVLNITYPAHLVDNIETINNVIHDLDGLKEIVYTKAQENILWIQEKFNEKDDSYKKIISIANNWDAAVELMKLHPCDTLAGDESCQEEKGQSSETWRDTGIIEDGEDLITENSSDMSKIYERLITDGRAGGKITLTGTQKILLNSIDNTANYKLIVLDNIFVEKGEQAKKRNIREWANSLSDSLSTPVVTLDELQTKYQFSAKSYLKIGVFGLLTFIIVFLVLNFSNEVIAFLSNPDSTTRIIATLSVLAFVPIYTYIYSTVTGLLLKLIKFE